MKKFKNTRSLLRRISPYLPKAFRLPLIRNMTSVQYELPQGLEMRIAKSRQDLEAAYKILHDSYVDMGYMKPDPSGMRIIKYFALPSTTTLVAVWKGQIVGTISIIRRTSFKLPMEKNFNIEHLITSDEAIAEVSSLAIAKEFRSQRGALFFPLCKYFFEYSLQYLRLQRVVVAVNPAMSDLYEGIFGFKLLKSNLINEYDFANGNPAVGLWAELTSLEKTFEKWYGHKEDSKNLHKFYFKHNLQELQYPDRTYYKAMDPVLTKDDLKYFFEEQSNVLSTLTQQEAQYLESLYPEFIKESGNVHRLPVGRTMPRFLVEIEARISGQGENSFRIIDVSKTGVRLQLSEIVFDDLNEVGRISRPFVELKAKVNDTTWASLQGHVRWFDQKSLSVGIEVKEFDNSWEKYISYLTADLSPVRKVS